MSTWGKVQRSLELYHGRKPKRKKRKAKRKHHTAKQIQPAEPYSAPEDEWAAIRERLGEA